VEAVDADAALALLESGTRVDVIFTDLSMPGSMDGLEFAHTARMRFPDLPVILSTGNIDDLIVKALPLGVAFVTKPFSRKKIAAAVQDALVHARGGFTTVESSASATGLAH
jgi:CheY-like chemotaxis protein